MSPLVTFFRVLPGLPPRRASKSGAGTIPTRAFQYCEPSRTACGFGYYCFLPFSFDLEWDGGTEALWSYDDRETWFPLTETAFPDSQQVWDAMAPENCRGYCPPFLSLSEVPGMLQIWTGWFARTAPGISLLVRSPANLTRSVGYETLEGIIEYDRWFGPVFTNLRLTRSGAPIHFDHMWPFLQLQPLPRECYADQLLDRIEVQESIPDELWPHYFDSLVKPVIHQPERGHYAKGARRRSRDAS
jgi:hypothetical protein